MNTLLKFLQRRFYSFAGTWAGCFVLLLGVYSLLLAAIHSLSPERHYGLRGRNEGENLYMSTNDKYYNYSDNIGHRDMKKYLTYDPIDAVYSWVNGSDPVWSRKKRYYIKLHQLEQLQNSTTNKDENYAHTESKINISELIEDTTPIKGNAMSDNRYRDSEELRYSLRSLVKYAPWIRKIYIVTDNQIPYWLNLEVADDRLQVVPHSAIFPNSSHLPVFSSPAIETHLHRIPGLSEKFIYFNDDVFLGAPVFPEDFFSPARHTQKLHMAWDVPKCAPGCSDSWLGDGYCDKACNVSECGFDYPDCVNGTSGRGAKKGSNRQTEDRFFCAPGCPNTWLGDKVCDNKCRTVSCGWDMGDCGVSLVVEDFPGVTLFSPLRNGTTAAKKPAGLISDDFKAMEVFKFLHGTKTLTHSTLDGVNLTVGPQMWPSTSSEGSSGDKSDTHLSEYPIALSVEYGVMGAYLNLSYLPCEALSIHESNAFTDTPYFTSSIYSPTCTLSNIFDPFGLPSTGYSRSPERGQRVAWSNFSYSSVSFDTVVHRKSAHTNVSDNSPLISKAFVEPTELLTSLALIQKHHLLIMLLYGHPDFYEDPSTDTSSPNYYPPSSRNLFNPVDIRFTVEGFNFETGINLTARFAVRITPATVDDGFADVNASNMEERAIPSGMGRVLNENATLVSCTDMRPLLVDKGVLRDPSDDEMVVHSDSLLLIHSIEVLEIPFRLPIDDTRFARGNIHCDLSHNCSTIDNQSHRNVTISLFSSPAWEGIAARVKIWPSSLQPHDQLSMQPLKHLQVRVTITANSGERHAQIGSLCEMVGTLSSHKRVIPYFKWIGDNQSLMDRCLGRNNSKSDNLLRLRDIIFPNTQREANVDTVSTLPYLDILLPIPITWKEASTRSFPSKPTSLFTKVEIFAPGFTGNGGLDFVHNSSRVACVNGPILWGDSDTVLDEEYTAKNSQGGNVTANLSNVTLNMTSYNDTSTMNRTDNSADNEKDIDTYAMSLVHVNKLYHKAFGAKNRRVPAHLPHLIDRDIMAEMQEKWKGEWTATSSHRFRSPSDMQYAFAYYYYLANRHEAHPPDIMKFVSENIDTDSDGYISDNELLTLATIIYQRNPTEIDFEELRNCSFGNFSEVKKENFKPRQEIISNYSDKILSEHAHNHSLLNADMIAEKINEQRHSRLNDVYITSSKYVNITKEPYGIFTETNQIHVRRFPSVRDIVNCSLVFDGLIKNVPWPAQHVFDDDKEVSFEMIGDNITEVRTQLNGVRASRKKFVCINDQMDNPSEELKNLLHAFYQSYFPFPSEFERSSDNPNPVLYLNEYLALRGNISNSKAAALPGGIETRSTIFVNFAHSVRYYVVKISMFAQKILTEVRLEITRLALKLCHYFMTLLFRFIHWLELEKEMDETPKTLRPNTVEAIKEVDLSEIHAWARGENVKKETTLYSNSDSTKLVKVEVWIPYSAISFSLVGLGFVLFLQRLQNTKQKQPRRRNSKGLRRVNSNSGTFEETRLDQFEISGSGEDWKQLDTDDGQVVRNMIPSQSVRSSRGGTVKQRTLFQRSLIGRLLFSIGLVEGGHHDEDDNISEDSVSTLGMGGYEDGVQHENFSSTIEQPITRAAPKKKKTNGGKESRLNKSVRWAKDHVIGESSKSEAPSAERKSLASIVNKLRKNSS